MDNRSISRVADSRSFYEIRVHGSLDEEWSARLRGLRITVDRSDSTGPVTLLSGELPDEAALNGVLSTLYALGLSLVSVGHFSEPAPDSGTSPAKK